MQLTSIRLIVRGAKANAEVHGVLTAGMVGVPVTIEYDDSWNGLSKNLVCRGGMGYEKFKGVSRTFLGVGTTEKVAPEVMIAGETLYLGIEGYNVDGTLVIPTTWACCGTIQEGVKTEGGPSEDPTLPIWEQLQARIDQFPGTIHDAIEEALKSEEFHPKDGNGIRSAVLNSDYTLTLNFDDGTSYTTPSIRGEAGKDYVLNEADKTEIAGQAAELVDLSEVFQNSDYSKLCIIDVTNGWSGIGKTYEEIQAEHNAGKILVLYHSGHTFDLVSAENGFVFERYYVEGENLVTDRCTLDEDMIFHVPRVSVLDVAGSGSSNEGEKFCIIDATNGWDSIDKTFSEIQEAHDAGKILVLYHTGHTFNLVSAGSGFVFERYYIEGTNLVTDRYSLDEDMIFYVPRASVIDISGGDVDLSGYVKSVNGQIPDENGNVEITIANDSHKAEKEYNAELSIIGFTRPTGTFSTSANGRRTGPVSTEGVNKIYGNLGVYNGCAAIAFYDANNIYLENISVIGDSLTPEGLNYGECTLELDISGDTYADAAFFVVSSYRDASKPVYAQTFDDDFCKYVSTTCLSHQQKYHCILR